MEYRRLFIPGAHYFFTVVTEGRKPLLVDHIDRLREAFRLCKTRYPFEIEAIVVMPDHIHSLWRLPEQDCQFSLRWMVIKRKFSAGLPTGHLSASKQQKREKGIWQRRFWEHCIRDEDDWRRHLDYIHYNPVKHGLAATALEWPHSSFKQAVAKGWYEPGWAAPPGLLDGMDYE